MPDEIWYLALIPLVLYVVIISVLAPRWDCEAPSDDLAPGPDPR